MTRDETLALQRAINAEFGWGLREDGIYGPKTAEAYQYYLNQKTPRNVPTPVPGGAKPWWQSRAVLGILVSMIAVIAERVGWTVDANTLTNLAVQVAEVAGLALAFVGTVRRRAAIDSSLVAPGVRIAARSAPVPPDSPTDRPAGPFGY
ncbi:MAG: hypothetical protein KAX46_04440 [Chromatiaceae bacterium]|nr:hypothetical protein [Chromatiaceae bacterium]